MKSYFIDYLRCAYCGKKTAWRYIWEADVKIINGKFELFPNWTRLIQGACPCKVPV